jgi:hypothetical protein
MTGFRFVVILNEVKDLYESSRDNVLQIPQLSVMNLFILHNHSIGMQLQGRRCGGKSTPAPAGYNDAICT